MLAHVGFFSEQLGTIQAPALVITAGQSHPRFSQVADRLLTVIPNAYQVAFAERSRLSPPMREEPDRIAQLLRDLWATTH